MPIKDPNRTVKDISFFHNLAKGTFYCFSFADDDRQVERLAHSIRKQDDSLRSDPFVDAYSELVYYLQDLKVQYPEDIPVEYHRAKDWWEMIEAGVKSDYEIFMYFAQKVPRDFYVQAREALREALRIWKPERERTIAELEKEGVDVTDPNS